MFNLLIVLTCLCIIGAAGSIYAIGLLRDLQLRPDARSQEMVKARAAAVLMNLGFNAVSLISSISMLINILWKK